MGFDFLSDRFDSWCFEELFLSDLPLFLSWDLGLDAFSLSWERGLVAFSDLGLETLSVLDGSDFFALADLSFSVGSDFLELALSVFLELVLSLSVFLELVLSLSVLGLVLFALGLATGSLFFEEDLSDLGLVGSPAFFVDLSEALSVFFGSGSVFLDDFCLSLSGFDLSFVFSLLEGFDLDDMDLLLTDNESHVTVTEWKDRKHHF